MIFPNRPIQDTDASFLHLPTGRRKLLGAMGLTGIGLIASSTPASAFLFQKKEAGPKVSVGTSSLAADSYHGIDLSSLPSKWVDQHRNILPQYSKYLTALKLQRITPLQVIEAHAKSRGSVWNTLPPKQWWNRMGYTLKVVDRVAVELNSPVEEIVSAYRSPAYNARCPGAKSGSWHQANVAIDVKFPMRASRVTSITRNLRDRGLFKGGVGGYSGFTHIDTRGTNINW